MWCEGLGVDDYKFDQYGDIDPKEFKTLRESSQSLFGVKQSSKREEKPPTIMWKKGNKWFSAVVPLQIDTIYWSKLFSRGYYDVVLWENMELEAHRIIREA